MERITSAQPPPCSVQTHPLDPADLQGLEYSRYLYKPRRGLKRGDNTKETYKLPHRLIEKKRRDRINECIAQLKDLLPEHIKLTTLGHLEKAVVLELTLKHVKDLSVVLEQQQQKIRALQNGMQIGEPGAADAAESGEEMFRSGFHLCAKEVLQYLANQESSRDLSSSHLISHIHSMATSVLPRTSSSSSVHHQTTAEDEEEEEEASVPAAAVAARVPERHAMNCVPVIQRTRAPGGHSEQSGSDTDTDSGYGGGYGGGAREKQQQQLQARTASDQTAIKQEDQQLPPRRHHHRHHDDDGGDEPAAKRSRCDSSGDETLLAPLGSAPGYVSYASGQPPFCVPFYLLPSAAAAAAAYLPMLEKCWYPGGMPVMYPPPGLSMGSSSSSSSSCSLQPDAPSSSPSSSSSSLVRSPRAGSPAIESPALRRALKQTPTST